MRILFVSSVYYPDVLGGGEISTKLAAEALTSQGFSVDVLCCGKGDIETVNGVMVYRIITHPYFLYENILGKTSKRISKIKILKYKYPDYFFSHKIYSWYRDFFMAGKYDLIQSNTPLANMGRYNVWKAASDLGIHVSHVFRCPALVPDHGLKMVDRVMRWRNSVALRYVDSFVGPSKYILDYNAVLDERISKGVVIPNAVEPVMKSDGKKSKMILYAGALNQEKGVLTLAKACMKLRNTAEIIFVGRGILKGQLESMGYKVIDWLDKEDLYCLIKKAWLLVLPSEWPEAFGRVIIEAVINDTLPLASNTAGIPEVLKVNPDLMFNIGDPEDLYSKLIKYLNIENEEYEKILATLKEDFERFSISAYKENWKKYITNC